jgi:hypothetical protein
MIDSISFKDYLDLVADLPSHRKTLFTVWTEDLNAVHHASVTCIFARAIWANVTKPEHQVAT